MKNKQIKKQIRLPKPTGIFRPNKEGDLPPWITVEDDTQFGQLYAPINPEGFVGQPFTHAQIFRELDASDRAAVKKEIRKGFHPVLLVDLESGVAAIEMRQHISPSEYQPPTPEQKKAYAAHCDCNDKYIAFRTALLREAIALKQVLPVVIKAKTKRGRK